jgi:hypothetical protein
VEHRASIKTAVFGLTPLAAATAVEARLARAGPKGRRWFWSSTPRVPQGTHDHGYSATREQAMADFKAARETPNASLKQIEQCRIGS